jgi:hypothetical protein
VTKRSRQNIITTLRGTNASMAKEELNMMMMTKDTNILNEVIEAPNDNDYHESQPQNSNLAISHPLR